MNNLKENLNKIRSRVGLACRTAERDPAEITVLAVSKRHPVELIRELHALGQPCFGENYVQEALGKIGLTNDLNIQWHFIGPLQSNKTKDAAEHFDWVQSIDREKTLRRLSTQRPKDLAPLNVCIQVNIDQEPQKSGAAPRDVARLARLATELPGLQLRGLMCIPRIASNGHSPADSYARMNELYQGLLSEGLSMDTLSMGMSADLEAAVSNGSTMVRIGTDLFGRRPS